MSFSATKIFAKILESSKPEGGGERGLNKTHDCMSLICETSGKVSPKDRNKRKRKSKSRLEMDSLLIHCQLVHVFVDKVYVARATVLPVQLGRVPCSGSRQIRNKNGAKWMSTLGLIIGVGRHFFCKPCPRV